MKILRIILTVTIILALSISLFILYFVIENIYIKIIGTSLIAVFLAIWLLFEYMYHKKRGAFKSKNIKTNSSTQPENKINTLILMTSDGEKEQQWHIEGAVSFLIGKSIKSVQNQAQTTEPTADIAAADIDLSDTNYSSLISKEHAVLNNIDSMWYIEDLNSSNGTGLRKKGEDYTFRLKPHTPYKISVGDIIFISKIKILVG